MSNLERINNFEDLQGDFSITYSDTKHPPRNTFHIHDAYEIMLVLSDNVELSVNNETYPVPYGSLLLFNTMDLHRIHYTGNKTYKRFVIWFKHNFLNDLENIRGRLLKCFYMRGFDKANLLILNEEQFSPFLDMFNTLNNTATKNSNMTDVLLKLLLGELLIAINELHFSTHPLETFSKTVDYISVFTAIQYIQENYSEKIDQNKLAKLTGTDKRTLCSNFRTLTGMSTGQYILNCRLTSAKAYLVQGLSVAEVCEKTGFENWSNFSRTFRNHIGLSPKQYAMKHKK